MKRRTGWLLLLLLAATINAGIPDSSFEKYADSLFNVKADSQKTYVKIVRTQHTFFLVTTCKTAHAPFDRIVGALQDIKAYSEYFKIIKRSGFISDKSFGDSVALFEAGVAFYVAWYVGKISQHYSMDRKECRMVCGNINQRLFKDTWTGKIGGLIQIKSHEVYMEWRVRDEGNGTSRISLTVSQAPAILIPRWLLKIAAANMFPGMLKELEISLMK